MKNVVLFGGGNQAHYTADIIEKEKKYKIIGIIDSKHQVGTTLHGYPVIGRQEDIGELVVTYSIDGGIVTIGDNWSRYRIVRQIESLLPTFQWFNAIHPSVIIGNGVNIGVGVVAMAGCIINPRTKIGNFTFFATGAQIDHDCEVNDYASVSAGSLTGGYVVLGKFSALTLGVTVLDRLKIGENCLIGAGSLVLKDVPDNVVAYGTPCRVIRTRKKDEKFLK